MMGDDIAIRSGGMYGNPESKYTLATPTSNFGGVSAFSSALKFGRFALDAYSASKESQFAQKQGRLDLEALYKERDYNVANFKQQMADTLASNKMSFYASGLDYRYGTAQNVIKSNQTALQNDLEIMKYNYDIQERNIKNNMKAASRRAFGKVASSWINMMF